MEEQGGAADAEHVPALIAPLRTLAGLPISRMHGPVQVLVVERRFGEAGVVVGDEARQEGVAVLNGADAGEPQLFHQAFLQRVVGALDAALGLAGVSVIYI